MITKRSTFKHQGQVVIEKVKILPPFRYESIFENSGCFIYFKEQGPRLFSARKKTKLKGHDAVLLKCGNHFIDLLKETEDGEVEVIVIHLYPELLKKLYTGDLPKITKKRSHEEESHVVASSDVITKFIESLEFYFQNPELVNNDLLELKIKELILLLVQSNYVNSILELIADLYFSKAIKVKEVIELHLFSNLNLDQLAALCNLSLSSFKREFKKEFDDSPTSYINGRRIEKSMELLEITDLPVGEIAFETGFQDALYFTRLFKKKVGFSPSAYRLQKSG
jgi:AraC-like DNA-binding protein